MDTNGHDNDLHLRVYAYKATFDCLLMYHKPFILTVKNFGVEMDTYTISDHLTKEVVFNLSVMNYI